MLVRHGWRLWFFPALLFGLPSPAVAFHTIFDYTVDRVEVDGGSHGPADGIPDFVDEFDNGTLDPDFTVSAGTAHVADGLLHLTNPGTHIPFGAGVDVSEVAGTALLHDGGGDFTITSYWTGGVREPDFVNLALFISGGTAAGNEFFGGALFNFGSEVSVQVYRGEGLGRTDADLHSLDAAVAHGPFAMRLSFDDDTNMGTVSFSFDGGATFQTYFEPIEIFRNRTDAFFVVGADPAQPRLTNCCTDNCTKLVDADGDGICDGLDNCPALAGVSTEDADGDNIGDACDACAPSQAGITWLKGRSLRQLKRDVTKWQQRADLRLPDGAVLDPVASGLRVQFSGPHEAPTDLVVLPGAVGANGAGWSVDATGRRFTFSDGQHGPRDGIRRVVLRVRKDGTVRLQFALASRLELSGTSLDPVNIVFPGMLGGCTQHAYAPGTCGVFRNPGVCRDRSPES